MENSRSERCNRSFANPPYRVQTLRNERLLLRIFAEHRLAQKGEIPAFKLGGTWRFYRSELDLWIAESINKKKPEAS